MIKCFRHKESDFTWLSKLNSIVNHSENANAVFEFDSEQGKVTFLAKRPILKGQEIVIEYCPEHAEFFDDDASSMRRLTEAEGLLPLYLDEDGHMFNSIQEAEEEEEEEGGLFIQELNEDGAAVVGELMKDGSISPPKKKRESKRPQ